MGNLEQRSEVDAAKGVGADVDAGRDASVHFPGFCYNCISPSLLTFGFEVSLKNIRKKRTFESSGIFVSIARV